MHNHKTLASLGIPTQDLPVITEHGGEAVEVQVRAGVVNRKPYVVIVYFELDGTSMNSGMTSALEQVEALFEGDPVTFVTVFLTKSKVPSLSNAIISSLSRVSKRLFEMVGDDTVDQTLNMINAELMARVLVQTAFRVVSKLTGAKAKVQFSKTWDTMK